MALLLLLARGVAAAPVVRVEVASPATVDVQADVSAGWDSNVRLLSPAAVTTGAAREDAFVAADVAAQAPCRADGWLLRADADGRQFLSGNGTAGAGSARAGWRWQGRALALEPAAEASAFAWSAFPDDAHVAASLAPEATLRAGRWSFLLAPAALGRFFAAGTDVELWVRAQADVRVGAGSVGLAWTMGSVSAADPTVSRQLQRVDLYASARLGAFVLGGRVSGGTKSLPAYHEAEGGPVGRDDLLATGRLFLRWDAAPRVSFTASLEGGAASSNMDSGRWTRVAAALLAEWRWERLGAAAGDAEAPRDVVLRVAAPGARQVAVAGTFTDWAPVELAPDGAGAFSGTVRAAPGEHRFGLLVDGAWTAPAGLPLRDDGLGGRDAVIVVPPP